MHPTLMTPDYISHLLEDLSQPSSHFVLTTAESLLWGGGPAPRAVAQWPAPASPPRGHPGATAPRTAPLNSETGAQKSGSGSHCGHRSIQDAAWERDVLRWPKPSPPWTDVMPLTLLLLLMPQLACPWHSVGYHHPAEVKGGRLRAGGVEGTGFCCVKYKLRSQLGQKKACGGAVEAGSL